MERSRRAVGFKGREWRVLFECRWLETNFKMERRRRKNPVVENSDSWTRKKMQLKIKGFQTINQRYVSDVFCILNKGKRKY